MATNELGLMGIEFVEFASPRGDLMESVFRDFGFSKIKKHKTKEISLWQQNDIHFLFSEEPSSMAERFSKAHGPSVSSMGWRFKDAKLACELACRRGARLCEKGDYVDEHGRPIPAIYGIGESLIYFLNADTADRVYQRLGFETHPSPELREGCGFILVDHLTNNVRQGALERWSEFYKNIFGFSEVRYFNIRGQKTGLKSFALKSPCGTFCIPINEGSEQKSQINEYLEEYKGEGIQHIAFLTHDICQSLARVGQSVKFLDIEHSYYNDVFNRIPNVTEDKKTLEKYSVLIDGDVRGYLLQIFTKNLFGPIFIEIIQRKNHFSFGEGNFGALFRSIELDQEKRGYL